MMTYIRKSVDINLRFLDKATTVKSLRFLFTLMFIHNYTVGRCTRGSFESPRPGALYQNKLYQRSDSARRTEKSEKWQPAFDGTRTQSLLVKKSLHLQQIIFPLNFFSLMKIIRNTLFKIVILRLFLVGFVARTAKDLQPAVVLCFFFYFFFFFFW